MAGGRAGDGAAPNAARIGSSCSQAFTRAPGGWVCARCKDLTGGSWWVTVSAGARGPRCDSVFRKQDERVSSPPAPASSRPSWPLSSPHSFLISPRNASALRRLHRRRRRRAGPAHAAAAGAAAALPSPRCRPAPPRCPHPAGKTATAAPRRRLRCGPGRRRHGGREAAGKRRISEGGGGLCRLGRRVPVSGHTTHRPAARRPFGRRLRHRVCGGDAAAHPAGQVQAARVPAHGKFESGEGEEGRRAALTEKRASPCLHIAWPPSAPVNLQPLSLSFPLIRPTAAAPTRSRAPS